MTKIYWAIAIACLVGAVFVMGDTMMRQEKKEVQNLRSMSKGKVFEEDWGEVESQLRPIIEGGKATADDTFTYALALHMQKQYARSVPLFFEAMNLGYSRELCEYNIACGMAQTGNTRGAVEHLRKAIEAGFWDAEWMAKDPDLKPIHGDAEFRGILESARKNAEHKSPSGSQVQR